MSGIDWKRHAEARAALHRYAKRARMSPQQAERQLLTYARALDTALRRPR